MKEYNEYCGAVNLAFWPAPRSARRSTSSCISCWALRSSSSWRLRRHPAGPYPGLVEYLFFTEQSLDMPNRTACDLFIRNNSSRVLPDDTVCVVVELANLSQINTAYGRERGNAMLDQFAGFLKEARHLRHRLLQRRPAVHRLLRPVPDGGRRELCRLLPPPHCGLQRREHRATYEYAIGISESKANNAYSIRALLREAMRSKTRQEG